MVQTSSEEVLKLQYSSKTAGNLRQFFILLRAEAGKGFMPLIKEDFPGKIYHNSEPYKHTQGVLTL